MKIAIAGNICSGKSTLANEIVERYSKHTWKRLSFAGRVKELANELFGMTVKDRNLLINLATKMRDIDEDVWVNALMKQIRKNDFVVVDDLRMMNEYFKLSGTFDLVINLRNDKDMIEDRVKRLYPIDWEDHMNAIETSYTENQVAKLPEIYFDFVIRNNNYAEFFEFLDEKLLDNWRGITV
jgi:cytidylate kinase